MGLSAVLATIEGGGYISLIKLVPVLMVLLLWARLLTWVDKDTEALRLPREQLNLPLIGGFVLGAILFFVLPNFFLAFAAMLLVFGAEAGIYLNIRKQKASFEDLKKDFRLWLKSLGRKTVEKKPEVEPGKVAIITKAGTPALPPAEDAPERAGYEGVQKSLTEALEKEAEQIELSPEAEGLAVKYIVDGVSYRGAVLDKTVGAAVISHLKEAAGLVVEEVRKPQSGSFKVVLNGKRRELKAQSAGTRAGEYMRLLVDPKKREQISLDGLGFSERQLGFVKELVADKKGIVLVSAPKSQGLTTTFVALMRAHDAFIEHLHTVERDHDLDLEGITQNRLGPTDTPEEEAKKVDWILSQQPDVVGILPIESPRTAAQLIAFAKEGHRVYVGLRASSTFEALDQWRKLVGDDRLAVQELRLVINGRILRKLCAACKAGYAPDPATLRKLGINPERVTALYQARTQPLRDPKGKEIPCEFCHELQFKGRMGVFETLMIDDEVREVVGSGKSPNQVFRKQRGKYLQEEALAIVEHGETSVQEVLRVLKAAPAPPLSATSSGAPAPGRSRSASAKPGKPAVRKG